AQKSLKKQIYSAHKTYMESIAEKAILFPKLFWAYVNKQRKSSSRPEFSVDGNQVTEPGIIAELFSDHFSSAWTTSSNPPPELLNMSLTTRNVPITSLEICEEDVTEALQRINPSQQAGPDGVHPAFLRLCSHRVSPILAQLFTNSLRAGFVPRQWKTARITPIHKGNGLSKSLVSSYRPISTTSIVCRTMERIVNRHLLEHIEQHQLLSLHQYGFRPGRSCELALATIVHTISSSLDGRTPCELIQLDFKQAFDRVDHSILLKKLSDIGVSGNFLKWITSFLLGRTQRVVFGGEMSSLAEVMSGIPQGSVLGPTLFNIFIDDITRILRCTPLLYADDLTLVQPIRQPLDNLQLQMDLDNVFAWSEKNRLPLNTAKCTAMQISASRQRHLALPTFNLGGVNISRTTGTRLLGVRLDCRLGFSAHIAEVTSRARRMLGFVTRVSRGAGATTLRHLYTALVLPHLEYCAAVWDPLQATLIASLESVQRRAAYTILRWQSPHVPRYRDMATEDLMTRVGWNSLALRRSISSIRLLATCLLPGSAELPLARQLRRSRTGGLQPLFARTDRHRHTFLVRAVHLWRSLPSELTSDLTDKTDVKPICREAVRHLKP
ncbi:MAG: reverse transcriptase family protein, partial [Anaplasma sp.]|nr:reverse transcriptase family protein [Anaplasma sp.]